MTLALVILIASAAFLLGTLSVGRRALQLWLIVVIALAVIGVCLFSPNVEQAFSHSEYLHRAPILDFVLRSYQTGPASVQAFILLVPLSCITGRVAMKTWRAAAILFSQP